VELRQTLQDAGDLVIVWVMAANQINPKSLRYIDGLGLRERIVFPRDPDSTSIDRLGLRRAHPEPIEQGVPNPTTYLLDREGVIRFVDVREDYHRWLDSRLLAEALEKIR